MSGLPFDRANCPIVPTNDSSPRRSTTEYQPIERTQLGSLIKGHLRLATNTGLIKDEFVSWRSQASFAVAARLSPFVETAGVDPCALSIFSAACVVTATDAVGATLQFEADLHSASHLTSLYDGLFRQIITILGIRAYGNF